MEAITADVAEASTYLYGRRTYETMAVWETDPALAEESPESGAFATTWRTRLERQLDAQVVAGIKAASDGDLTIGGPTLAAEALRLNLVDVVELLWFPVLLGGGIPVLSAGVRRDLRLRNERRFGNGVVQATYDVIGRVQP
jgi:dihydrofolate reductase